MDGAGWGSPFLLVPEATNVDEETLRQLASATKDDYFLSQASPLGVPFNNFRRSSSEAQRRARIAKGRPGSPCYKKFLAFNTELTSTPICTASREYQHLKLKELAERSLSPDELRRETDLVTEKECLCEGLGAGVLLKNGIEPAHKLTAASVCPGPNLAYFSGTWSLREMVDHIYGRGNTLNALPRPHMFVNELALYVAYLKGEVEKAIGDAAGKPMRSLRDFKANLLDGIAYYRRLLPTLSKEPAPARAGMGEALCVIERALMSLGIPEAVAGEASLV